MPACKICGESERELEKAQLLIASCTTVLFQSTFLGATATQLQVVSEHEISFRSMRSDACLLDAMPIMGPPRALGDLLSQRPCHSKLAKLSVCDVCSYRRSSLCLSKMVTVMPGPWPRPCYLLYQKLRAVRCVAELCSTDRGFSCQQRWR